MADANEINMGAGAQAKQVAAAQIVSQTYIEKQIIESARRDFDARFSLPKPPRDFTGRANEIEMLVSQLTRGERASISGVAGMGGIGKSALAQIVAQRVAENFSDAQIWLDMRGLDEPPTTPSDAMRQVILAFEPDAGASIKDLNDAQLAQMYRGVLHGKRALLVLDNARDNVQIRPLLQADAAFLVTSRATLTEAGLKPLRLDVMKEDDAREYVIALCERLKPTTDDGQPTVVDELCETCGYLPLALKIAGSYLGATPNIEIARYIEKLRARRLEILRERGDDELNVEAAFALAYAQLPPTMQLTWRLLAVFPAPFWDTAAAYVWGVEQGQAQDELGELIRYSLVEYGGEEKKYRLHDLLREFATTRLSADKKWQARKRHAEFYFSIARDSKKQFDAGREDRLKGILLFAREFAHIRAGQAFAKTIFYRDGSDIRLMNDYNEVVGRFKLYFFQAHRKMRTLKAIKYYEQALEAAQKTSDKRAESNRLADIGRAYLDLHSIPRAIEYFEKALFMAKKIGDRRFEASLLENLGSAYEKLDDVSMSQELRLMALAIYEAIEDPNAEWVRKKLEG